jgi:hypothetical protein
LEEDRWRQCKKNRSAYVNPAAHRSTTETSACGTAAHRAARENGKRERVADLRKFAREWQHGCLIRVPGYCVWEPTCLCHDREASTGGGSQKPPDECGMIGCDACHSIVDRRAHLHEFSMDEIRAFKHHALLRTWAVYSIAFQLTPTEDSDYEREQKLRRLHFLGKD